MEGWTGGEGLRGGECESETIRGGGVVVVESTHLLVHQRGAPFLWGASWRNEEAVWALDSILEDLVERESKRIKAAGRGGSYTRLLWLCVNKYTLWLC